MQDFAVQDPDDPGAHLLFPGAHVTKDQASVLILAYLFRHNISGKGQDDLLHILDILFPKILPKSKYLFSKEVFGDTSDSVVHLYCRECFCYIGNALGCEWSGSCILCTAENNFKQNVKEGFFFISVALEPQLKDLLENHGVASKLIMKSEVVDDPDFIDIFSGKSFRKLISNQTINDTDLTIIFNIDGVPVFSSSNSSIWPFQCIVNELPQQDRKRHVLLTGLWFGPSKPIMHTFLEPLKTEAIRLGEQGFQWSHPDSGSVINSRVFFMCTACDSVARPIVRNCTQFNGKHGCDWCYHPGEVIAKGRGHVRCYPYTEPEPTLRCLSSHERESIRATNSNQIINGVKGPSLLMFFPHFNIVDGFTVDYMHCVMLGVVRQFCSLWFDSVHHDAEWYIDTQDKEVDTRLLGISPPHELSRVPRSLSQRKFWKASEWRSFLLYYSCIVLRGILPGKYLNHFFLLVHSMYALLSERITQNEVDLAGLALRKFVIMTAHLYGKKYVSFNVHQLCHISNSVERWGPAWAISAFPFEGNNQVLLKLIHGTQCIPQQIAERFQLYRSTLRVAKNSMHNAESQCQEMHTKLIHIGAYMPHNFTAVGKIKLLGKSSTKQLNVEDRAAIEGLLGVQVHRAVKYFQRFEHGGCLYTSSKYHRASKRNNTVVELTDGTICVINSIILYAQECTCDGPCNCVGTPFIVVSTTSRLRRAFHRDTQLRIDSKKLIIEVDIDTDTKRAIHVTDLKRKCVVCSKSGSNLTVIVLPNRYETD